MTDTSDDLGPEPDPMPRMWLDEIAGPLDMVTRKYADYWKLRAQRAGAERDYRREENAELFAENEALIKERDEARAALARAEDACEKDGKARAEAAGMQMEIDELRELLREAMRRAQNHEYICASDHGNVTRLCNCGLNDLRARVAAVLGEKP